MSLHCFYAFANLISVTNQLDSHFSQLSIPEPSDLVQAIDVCSDEDVSVLFHANVLEPFIDGLKFLQSFSLGSIKQPRETVQKFVQKGKKKGTYLGGPESFSSEKLSLFFPFLEN